MNQKEKQKEFIELNRKAFEMIMDTLEFKKPFYCKYCEDRVTKENFGLIAKDIISCNNIMCLSRAVEEFEK